MVGYSNNNLKFNVEIFNNTFEKEEGKMSLVESVMQALFTMFVVFAVLACLYVLIKLFSFGIRLIEAAGKKSE
jgi:hypothetical protein